jgi:hypothetical protein
LSEDVTLQGLQGVEGESQLTGEQENVSFPEKDKVSDGSNDFVEQVGPQLTHSPAPSCPNAVVEDKTCCEEQALSEDVTLQGLQGGEGGSQLSEQGNVSFSEGEGLKRRQQRSRFASFARQICCSCCLRRDSREDSAHAKKKKKEELSKKKANPGSSVFFLKKEAHGKKKKEVKRKKQLAKKTRKR